MSSEEELNAGFYTPTATSEVAFGFDSAKTSFSTEHGSGRDSLQHAASPIRVTSSTKISPNLRRVAGSDLEQLKEDSNRSSFQAYLSDTALHDPSENSSPFGNASSHMLETDTRGSIGGGSSMSSGSSDSSIYNYKKTDSEFNPINNAFELNQSSMHDGADLFPSEEHLSLRIKDMLDVNDRKVSILNPGKSVANIISRISFKTGAVEDKEDCHHLNEIRLNKLLSIPDGESNSSFSEQNKNDASTTSSKVSPFSSPKRFMGQRKKEKKLKAQSIPQPKNLLPVKCFKKSKNTSEFNPLLLISTLNKSHEGPIWCTEFSKDGKYLATGGKDGVLQIWSIAPSKDVIENITTFRESSKDTWSGMSREDDDSDVAADVLFTIHSGSAPLGTDIIVISPTPVQRFTDHEKDIVDLSWSETGFLVSASMDKTARLWHPTRSKCLRVFRHADVVTSVEFHPKEDRYFLSGGFDKKIRIWNIPNGRVVEWAQSPHVITAATFQPDGKYIAAGLFDGKVIFYSLEDLKLKYFTQITAKNRRSKRGKKVTGLTFLPQLSEDKVETQVLSMESPRNTKKKAINKAADFMKSFTSPKRKAKQQLLITTNDSRLRLVGTNDFCMVRKYKGHLNSSLQIKAKFSESGDFIISGSEAKTCNIWNTATRRNPLNVNVTGLHMYDKVNSYEAFDATKCDPPIVTDASFVPSKSAKAAIMASGLFPSLKTLDSVHHDLSSSIILTTDYAGTIRVFLQRSCLDALAQAAGPSGVDFS